MGMLKPNEGLINSMRKYAEWIEQALMWSRGRMLWQFVRLSLSAEPHQQRG
jgi:hypothetical protein